MPRRVNAALAACLVGVSEKTMTAWMRSGKIPGAVKVNRMGRPEEWDIGMEELHNAVAGLVDEDRIAAMIEWIDLHRGTGGMGGTASGAVPPSAPTSSSPSSSGGSRRFRLSAGHVPGTFRDRGEAINFLVRHGINARTARDWRDDWALVEELTPSQVLSMAQAIHERQGWRARWRLYECGDPGCVCHSLL